MEKEPFEGILRLYRLQNEPNLNGKYRLDHLKGLLTIMAFMILPLMWNSTKLFTLSQLIIVCSIGTFIHFVDEFWSFLAILAKF